MDDPRAMRLARRAELRDLQFEEPATVAEVAEVAEATAATAAADAKWDWYKRARESFTGDFGTKEQAGQYREAPHCPRCERLCQARFIAVELTSPQPARVGNEDPPKLSWSFESACYKCHANVIGTKSFEKVVLLLFTQDDVESLLTSNQIQGNLRTYLLECWREGTPHTVKNRWLWTALTDQVCHPFA